MSEEPTDPPEGDAAPDDAVEAQSDAPQLEAASEAELSAANEPPAPTAEPSPALARCAVHEDAQATGTCVRCGNYVCPLCLDPSSDRDDMCDACRDRVGADIIPWERDDGSIFARWGRTVSTMVLRPSDTFERTQPGSWASALGFASLTGAFIGIVFTVLGICAVGLLAAVGGFDILRDDPAFAEMGSGFVTALVVAALLLYPLITVLMTDLIVVVRALLFHLPVALMDGKGGLGASMWATSYLSAVHLAWLPLAVLQQVPFIGPLLGLFGYLVIEIWYALALTTVARRYHGLEGGRATFAGWFPFLAFFALTISCCVLGMLLALSMPGMSG